MGETMKTEPSDGGHVGSEGDLRTQWVGEPPSRLGRKCVGNPAAWSTGLFNDAGEIVWSRAERRSGRSMESRRDEETRGAVIRIKSLNPEGLPIVSSRSAWRGGSGSWLARCTSKGVSALRGTEQFQPLLPSSILRAAEVSCYD